MLIRANGTEEELAAKLDQLTVEPGDRLLYITGGGGGWGDPLERDPSSVRLDVLRGFVSLARAQEVYGVVLDPSTEALDGAATGALRSELRSSRPEKLPLFDFGPGGQAQTG